MVGPQRKDPRSVISKFAYHKKFGFSDRRIEVSSRPIVRSRPSKTTPREESEANSLDGPDGSVSARATFNIAIPPRFNGNEWLRWPGIHDRLPPK